MEDLKAILANTKTNSTYYVTVKDRTVSVRATADIQTIVDLKAENAELKKALTDLLIETSKVYSTSGGLAGAEIKAKAILARSGGE